MIIKENQIYFLIFFFGYGVAGAGIANGSNLDIFYLISPLIFFTLIFFIKRDNETLINFKINLLQINNNKDLISIFLIFSLLILLVFDRIILSIADDEYAYASLGLIHSNFIIPLIAKNNIFENLEVRHLYRIISIIIILSIFLYFYLLDIFLKNNLIIKLIIIIISVVFVRYIIFKFGGNPFPHPPLISLIPLVSTSIFGLSDLSLKLIPFVIYGTFSTYYYFRLRRLNNVFDSFLITLTFFGIPGVLFLGATLEQGLFSMICFSIVSIELILNEKNKYKKLFIIILIFSLFRVLSILSLILIAAHILYKSVSIKNFIINSFNALKESYPLLLLVPFIMFSFTSNQYITVDRVGSDFFNAKFFYFDLPYSILDGFTIIPGVIVLITLMILIFYIKKTFLLFAFLLFSILVYGNVILNDNKYVYEIFFPIILSSILIYYHLVQKKWIKNSIIIILILCNISNFLILKNFNKLCLEDKIPFKDNLSYVTNFGCKIIYSKPFNLKKTYTYLKNYENFNFKNLYVPGVYYGLLPSIINGIKVSEFIDHKQLNINQNNLNAQNDINWTSASSDNINSDININFLILGDLSDSSKLTDELVNSGWKEIYKKKDPIFNTLTVVLSNK